LRRVFRKKFWDKKFLKFCKDETNSLDGQNIILLFPEPQSITPEDNDALSYMIELYPEHLRKSSYVSHPPLLTAIWGGKLHKVQMLINHQADIYDTDQENNGLMHYLFCNCFRPDGLYPYNYPPLDLLKYILSLPLSVSKFKQLFQHRNKYRENSLLYALKAKLVYYRVIEDQNLFEKQVEIVTQSLELTLKYFENNIARETMSQIPKHSDYYAPMKTIMESYYRSKKKVEVAYVIVKKYKLSFKQEFIIRYIMDFLDFYVDVSPC